MNQHLAKAKQYLTIAESGDAKREAYKAAAEEVAAYKAETNETNEEIGRKLKLSPTDSGAQERVSILLRWRKSGYKADTPYTMTRESTQESSTRSTTKRVMRDPARRAKVLDEMTVDERVSLAQDLVRDPKVREEVATDYGVREAVGQGKREERGRRRELRYGLPLSHLVNTVSVRAVQWTGELRRFYDELETIPYGADRVKLGAEFRALGDQAYRWANKLEGTDKGLPELELIEGEAS